MDRSEPTSTGWSGGPPGVCAPDRARAVATPEQFIRVREAYLAAEAAPPGEREAAALRVAGDDPGVRQAVLAMLAADAEPGPIRLETPLVDLSAALEEGEASASANAAMPAGAGPYRILRQIGSGATGDVYLADQEEPVRRRVAVKILRPGLVGRSGAARFAREARALAALDHPGIARIIDAGRMPDGRPYLAMEHIDGAPIDRAGAELPLRDRVRLLAHLADAVRHAHQRGVIHRDLKPSNVLVVDGDAGPEVRVIDFGVARLIETEGDGRSLTLCGQAIGTLGYMSPEQLRGEPADVRSDIFALGMLIRRVGLEIAEPAGAPRPAARLRRDIEAIAERATAPDAEDRYPSAGDVADELRRVLTGRPVEARGRSPAYLAARFVRRHPWSTGAASAGAAALLVAGLLLWDANARLRNERHAQQELVSGAIIDLMDRMGEFGGTAQARAELAQRLLERIDALLELEPGDAPLLEAKARLLNHLGSIKIAAGRPLEARPLQAQAAEIYETIAPTRPGDVSLGRRHAEAIVLVGDTYVAVKDWVAAAPYYLRAKAMHEEMLSAFSADSADPLYLGLLDDYCWSYDRLTQIVRDRSGPQAAEAHQFERLRLAEDLFARDPSRLLSVHNLAQARHNYGVQLLWNGRPEEALPHALEAVALADRAFEREPRVYFVRNCEASRLLLAEIYSALGRLEEAQLAAAEAEAVLRSFLDRAGDDRGDVRLWLAEAILLRAKLLRNAGQPQEAAAAAGEVMDILAADNGSEHADLVATLRRQLDDLR